MYVGYQIATTITVNYYCCAFHAAMDTVKFQASFGGGAYVPLPHTILEPYVFLGCHH